MTTYRYRFSFGHGLAPAVKNLMIAMGVVFLVQQMLRMTSIDLYVYYFLNYFALDPEKVWNQYYIWQLFTYIFLHGDFFHILFNLFSLWMFGGELESHWGSRRFLFYFFFCGIGAGIFTVLLSPYPVIGASGAIYGVLLAFGWLFPNRPIYIYFLFPLPAKYMVIIFGLIEFFSSGSAGDGVAHLTHLGGLVFGFFFMAYPAIRQKLRRENYKRKWSQRGPGGGGYYH
ncbi:MAG: rhomboid family intramembrane serine protease [Desulfobacterales bacterium]|nr:rhomboid family intramembrane serine protease [Desulfobacterales bacterium]